MGPTGVLAGILAAARSRFVFVVGKGGVGKSTTAGALALGLAEAGERTHLLSTDPAHSVADLFGVTLPRGATEPSPCSDALTLEEFDAGARARAWMDAAAPALADLVDAGTYLDREDVDALLAHALPGMDELMAALRLGDLCDDPDLARVVIDTAPTGHTLRLLDAGRVLGGWAGALGAMADKARAVASQLAGRRVRFAGETVLEDLRARVERFERDVLARADFVVVTRAGDVVRAETDRLVDELDRRGLGCAALVAVGAVGAGAAATGGRSRFDVPLRQDPRGCEGLRGWGAPGDTVSPSRAIQDPPPASTAVLDRFRGRRLLLFAGKGGVGKSTCAAACAVALAENARVLLLGTDPAGSLGDVLGAEVGPEGRSFGPNLVARQVDAEGRLERFRETYEARIRDVFRSLGLEQSAPLDRRVLESILGLAPPGIDEIFALEALLDEADRHDVLIIDSAPTGHFLRLLEMPGTALSWARTLLRILLKYRAVLGLDDVAEDVLQLARNLKDLIELLQDPVRTGVVVVTVTETLPRLETERLVSRLALETVPVLAVLENRPSASAPRPSSTARDGSGQVGADRLSAPYVDPAPIGPAALRSFASGWIAA